MKYAVLVYLAERMWLDADQGERDTYHQAHVAFAAAVAAREDVTQVAGEALATVATATTLRRDAHDQPQVVDGPFAETTEVLGGFYLLEAPDLTRCSSCAPSSRRRTRWRSGRSPR